MKKLASRRLSPRFIFGLLLRGAAAGAGQPGSCRSTRPRRRVRASRAGWTLAVLTLAALAGSARTARAQNPSYPDLFIDDDYRHNSPYTYSDANGTQTFGNIYVGLSSTGTLNQTGGTLNAAGGLTVANSSGSTGTYNLSGGSLNAAAVLVGGDGTGTVNQTGGAMTIQSNPYTQGELVVGYAADSTGTYNLSAGSISAQIIEIGGRGVGTFNQTGGTATSSASLLVGEYTGSNGTYNLSGGTLSTGAPNNNAIGNDGTGTFNQTGGTFTTNGNVILVGNKADGIGVYKLSAGSVISGYLSVGYGGNGTFTQTGGSITTIPASSQLVNIIGTMTVGELAGSTGTYNLSDGGQGSSLSTRTAFVGLKGTGTFNQTGGTFTTNGNPLYLGYNAVGNGTYNLSGTGSLSTSEVVVGNAGTGVFNQTGGTFTTNGNFLVLGGSANAGGTYNLSGTGSLSTGVVVVGNDATGVFNQTGGTFTTNGNFITLGSSANAGGTYNLSGTGNLSTGTFYVGNAGTGVFNQTGGTFTTNGNTLSLGYRTGGNGTYNLNGGVLTVGNVSGVSTSTFNFNGGTLQAGGNNVDFFQALTTANVRNGGAVIDTSGYNVTAAQPLVHSIIQGDNGTDGGLTKLGQGTLTLTGTNTYTGQTTVGQGTLAVTAGGIGAPGATSNLTVNLGSGGPTTGTTPTAPSLTLSGSGTQVFFNNAFIGSTAAGSVSQSGGTFTTGNVLYLGYSGTNATTGNGTYTLSGGTLNTHETQVGNGGTGTFNHSDGTQTVTTTLYLGLNNGTGTYNLSNNGVLQASAGIVGYTGTGTFNQSGGSANFGTGGLTIGSVAGSQGTYGLGTGSNGGATASLNSSGPIYVGYSGAGTVNQQVGGSLSTNGNALYLGYNAGSLGTFNLAGGEVDTADGSTVGYAGTGVFNHTGGANLVSGTLVLGHAAGSSGTYNLSGGGLVAGQVTSQGGTSTFNFNGGTLQASANSDTFFQGLTRANVRNGGATVDTQGYNVTVAQPLQHSNVSGDNGTDGGLTKLGAGVLTLTGANTYNGGTRVQAGTLLVNNTSGSGTGSGQVTLFSTAVLGGSGTVGGNVVAQAGATVAPGAAAQLSTARLTLGGTLTLQSNSLLAIKLGWASGGSGYDQVFAGGGFTLAGNLQVSLVNGFTPAVGQPFTILDNTNLFGGNSGVFANAPDGIYTTVDGLQFAVGYATNFDGGFLANDVTLFYLGTTVVPEPGTWAWLLVGVGALATRHAWRRQRPGQV